MSRALLPINIEIPYILTKDEELQAINYQKKLVSENNLFDYFKKEIEIKRLDIDKILKRANNLKYYDLQDIENKKNKLEKLEIEKKEFYKNWTAEKIYNFYYQNSLLKNDKTNNFKDETLMYQNYIKAVIYFLCKDKRFETEIYRVVSINGTNTLSEFKEGLFSLKRGLLIRGNFGVGKTHLIRCLANNELCPIKMLSMIDIANVFETTGKYSLPAPIYNKFNVIGKLYIDDLGTEDDTKKHFGTSITTWVKDFIESCYYNENTFSNLILSTNLNWNEIKNKYGERVESRMREKFNVIDVYGEDRRKTI